jgi:uncharacterized membrane protein YraQ (UPF0718 family)
MSDCHKPEPPKPDSSCCETDQNKVSQPDYLLWISGSIVVLSYLAYLFIGGQPQWLLTLTSSIYELINKMWWGLLMAVVFVGLLERIPRDLVISALGQGGTFKGIVRATAAGVLLDLCSHGILMVGTKLYERGASLGQLMAFLIASPWNSLSLTIILITLIGFGWTLAFIALSMIVGIVTGLLFDRLVAVKMLPANPNSATCENSSPIAPQLINLIKHADYSPKAMAYLIWDGLRDSRMVFRWLFFGLVLASAIRAFVPLDIYQTLFGPTVAGLFATLLAATIIEVCSEGSAPIAADLLSRAAAPGNGFTFLMAGIATDYTEVMVIRDTTKSWKIALFLPLLTVPQVLLIGWLLNQF